MSVAPVKTMTLDDGTIIPEKTFFQIFGSGVRKQKNKVLSVKVDGHDLPFTASDLSLLQEVIDRLVAENLEYQARITAPAAPKPRIRVKAGSIKSAGKSAAPSVVAL